MTLIYLVAGEASGDVLGGRLMHALRARCPGASFAGIGGDRMVEAGLTPLFGIRELSLMGLLEVAPRVPRLLRRLAQTVADVAARRPAVLVTIDAPGFCLRLARRVRGTGVPVVHYVAPQVWAWQPGRAREVAERCDRLLTLLPFEVPIFEAAGARATFVGHPVLESGADAGDAAGFRARHGIGAAEQPIIVMPGSRRGEARRLLPAFGDALRIALAERPQLRPVVPLTGLVAPLVRAAAADWPGRPILLDAPGEKPDAFAAVATAGGAGLIKSGTSSLEMAVAGVPHVVVYKLNPVTAAIARRLIRVEYASLVNLLCGRAVVPERLQEAATPAALAEALLRPIADPAEAARQRAGFTEALTQLRAPEGAPSEAAAAAVLAVARQRRPAGSDGVVGV